MKEQLNISRLPSNFGQAELNQQALKRNTKKNNLQFSSAVTDFIFIERIYAASRKWNSSELKDFSKMRTDLDYMAKNSVMMEPDGFISQMNALDSEKRMYVILRMSKKHDLNLMGKFVSPFETEINFLMIAEMINVDKNFPYNFIEIKI